jgi:chloride channel protein, CIC family
MIGSIVAYFVAEWLFPDSLYQHLLVRRGINIELPDAVDRKWEGLTAADIMQRRVESLASQMPLDEAIQAFAHSHHRGFPIVDGGVLVGILTQSDLAALKSQPWDGNTPLAKIMTRRVVTATPQDPLTSVLHLLNHHQVSRLPVVDGHKLVGIITRADIIRCEAERISSNVSPLKPQPRPSYSVYQTRSPATGKGRLLLPLSNPQKVGDSTIDRMWQLVMAIAIEYDYEIECLHTIVVPHSSLPSETSVNIAVISQLLEKLTNQGKSQGVSVHTQVRVAHNPATTILEAIKERHIDLLCMDWQGRTSAPGRIFGNTLDTAIRQAPCPVMVIKFGQKLSLDRWLVPIAGGPNSKYALQLLPALTTLGSKPEIQLCQCFDPKKSPANLRYLDTAANFVRRLIDLPTTVIPLYSDAIAATVLDLAAAKECDAIILGASREGLLKQAMQGNIPESIAQGSDCTLIVVRKAISE